MASGKFGFVGVLVTNRGSVTNTLIDTAIASDEFDSYDEAEAAAKSWAKEHGIAELLIETDKA